MMNSLSASSEKNTDWFGVIPHQWRVKRIKHVSSHIINKRLPNDGEIKISPENVESNTGKIKSYYSKYETEGQVFQNGDILFNKIDVSLNKVVHCHFDGLSMGEMIVIRPHKILGGYLSKVITSKPFIEKINSLSRGVKLPRPPVWGILNGFIPIPPPNEQNFISTYLNRKTEQIDSLIEKLEKKIELLKEQRIALINQCITKGLDLNVEMKDSGVGGIGEIPKHWKLSKIKWITDKIGSGVTPRGGSEVYSDEGIPFLRSQNIHFDGIRLEEMVYISDEIDQSMQGSRVKKNDVLYNITGASIGRCCLVQTDLPMNVNQHVCIVRPSKNVMPEFLEAFLSSSLSQNQLQMNLTGASREGINFMSIGNFQIPLADLSEQERIGGKISEISRKYFVLMEKLNSQIELLKEYRQSLISSVVTGKVRVTEDMV